MDLPRFLAIVRARRWLIVGMVLVATVLALAGSLAQPSRYKASADLLFGQTTNTDAIVAGSASDSTVAPDREAATNLALASLDGVAARVKQRFRGPVTVDEIRQAVTIEGQGTSDLATVTAEWSSPDQAAAVANAFASEIVAQRRETERNDIQKAIDALQARVPRDPKTTGERLRATSLQDKISDLEYLKATADGNVHLVERAASPDHRSSPTPVRNAVIAGCLAAILSLLLIMLLARFDDRIRDDDELTGLLGAPVLARIPRVRSRRLLPANSPYEHPAFLEAFEFLRLNLQLTEPERGSVVLAVTSPGDADGKTTVVSWLARSLALGGAEVTAVDLDVRKPELHDYLNAIDEPGNGAPPREPDDTEPAAALPREPDDTEPAAALPREPDDTDPAAAPPTAGRRGYTAEDIRAGLGELVRSQGNVRRAAVALKSAGRDISETTLRRWKVHHAPLYAELDAAHRNATGATDTPGGAASLTQPTMTPHVRLMAGSKLPALPIVRKRVKELFDQLRRDADYVLVDTVPVSTVADASAVASAADAVILVVDLQRARRRDIIAAKRQLGNARADLRGIVLNRAAVERPGDRYQDRDYLDDPLADRPRR